MFPPRRILTLPSFCSLKTSLLKDNPDNIELIKSMCKMPTDLLNHFMNDDPIVFLINPPYATASNGKSKVLNHTI